MSFHQSYLAATLGRRPALEGRLATLRGSKIFVSGASGIVGLAVSNVLEYVGAKVVAHSREPYAGALALTGRAVDWIHGDLASAIGTAGQFDYTFHCATFGQPEKFSRAWRETIGLNVDVLLRLLDVSQKLGFASTSEIYSGISEPGQESMNGCTTPQHPRSGYIEAKRLGEAICFHSGRAVANRIALASGPYPKPDDSRAIYQIIRRAKHDGYVSLQGGGGNVRQYQYSFACALRFIVSTCFGSQPVYNNAGPYLLSMRDLAAAIASSMRLDFRGGDEGEGLAGAPSLVRVDTSRIRNEFPELDGVDPSLNAFVDAIVEAAHAYA